MGQITRRRMLMGAGVTMALPWLESLPAFGATTSSGNGEFPKRFALSARCVVWDLAEVEAWLAARRSTPLARAPHPDVRQRRTRPVKGPGRAAGAASKGE